MPGLLAAPALLITLLRVMLFAKVGGLVAKVLLFFGLTFAVNSFAIAPIVDQLKSQIQSGAPGSLGGTVMQWAGVVQLDVALSMILSAYAAAWTIKTAKAFLMKTS